MSPHDLGVWLAGAGLFIIASIALLTLALTIFWIVELIDAARREFPDPNTKILWILVILFTHAIGAIIYYFAGKPQGTLPGQAPYRPNINP